MEENMMFQLTDEEGNSVECEVILTYKSEEIDKLIVIYTDNNSDEDGNLKIYAACCDENNPEELLPIEDKYLPLIEKILKDQIEDVE